VSRERILIISHRHPDLSLGGSELAAYAHWKELRRQGIEAMFLAGAAFQSGHVGTPFSARSADGREVLFHAPPVDHFRHSQPQRHIVYDDFRALLEHFAPTAVHFHHYVHLGLELVREVRRFGADLPIVMTLHEYLAVCNAQGQMLKTDGSLCRKAAPLDCHGCFPERSPQEFFMRELFIKSFLGLVDHFICPSQFLRDRYVAWGLPSDRMTVLENGLGLDSAAGSQGPADDRLSNRFLVLGQLSRRKGTLLLLDAVEALPKEIRERIRIELYGSMQYAEEDFKARVQRAQETLSPALRCCGPYFPENVDAILRSAGWVIVPSIWWENSPLVIQEAFRARRPVICSNIGGMAEKVQHGISGLHFMAGSAVELARCIQEAASSPGLLARLSAGTPQPPNIQQTVAKLLSLYRAGRDAASHAAAERTEPVGA